MFKRKRNICKLIGQKKTPPTFVIRCTKLNSVCFEGAPLIISARNVKLFFTNLGVLFCKLSQRVANPDFAALTACRLFI